MNKIDWTDEYKAKVRTFMQTHGSPVQFAPIRYSFDKADDVSTYGWNDWHKASHVSAWDKKSDPCSWVVPEGAKLYERVYSQFDGTQDGG